MNERIKLKFVGNRCAHLVRISFSLFKSLKRGDGVESVNYVPRHLGVFIKHIL
jgi:hypothetical protein